MAVAERNPFEILGVDFDDPPAMVRAAYLREVKLHHPDANGGRNTQEFLDVQWAYERLNDPIQREEDEKRFRPKPTPPISEGFDGFFRALEQTGRHANPARMRMPRTMIELSLSLEQAFAGGSFLAGDDPSKGCTTCHGKGRIEIHQRAACPNCSGKGFLRAVKGIVSLETECEVCSGSGRVNFKLCPTCSGQVSEQVQVDVPPGCRDGYEILVARPRDRMGVQMPEVKVVVRVQQHAVFRRKDDKLFARLTVPVWDAALGGTREITGVDGKRLMVRFPPATQTGSKLVLRQQGMWAFPGRGDLEVQFEVTVPDASAGELQVEFLRMKRREEEAK